MAHVDSMCRCATKRSSLVARRKGSILERLTNSCSDEKIEGSSNRALGLTFGVVFLIVGIYPLVSGATVRAWSIVVSVAFVLAALAVPRLLTPLNKLWTRFGLLLHRMVNPIVLGIMFFAVVTPTGLLMRALGKDLLRLRMDRDAPSYRLDRKPPGPKPATLSNQF